MSVPAITASSLAILAAWALAAVDESPRAPVATEQVAPVSHEFDLSKRRAEHWVWQPVQPTVPPPVRNEAWVADPIDRFVLARLEGAGIDPALPADKPVLLRRIYFDLIGLPPPPAE